MGEKLWRKNLINIEPYVAGEQPKNDKIIKLNANENPYPPSPKVKAILEGKTIAELRKYPSADASVLRAALAERVGLKSENVFCGNGSDDVLATAFRAFFNSDKPILYPDITYSFYPVWCELLKIPYKTKSVDDDFVINIEDFKEPNGGVVIPNPNAPTSLGVGEKFIRELLENNQDSIVIIDEAYVDFGRYSCVELVKEYDNLVVTQTFSKSRSLAGMRVGMAFASAELISYMQAFLTRIISRRQLKRSRQQGIEQRKKCVKWASTSLTAKRIFSLHSMKSSLQRRSSHTSVKMVSS